MRPEFGPNSAKSAPGSIDVGAVSTKSGLAWTNAGPVSATFGGVFPRGMPSGPFEYRPESGRPRLGLGGSSGVLALRLALGGRSPRNQP